MKLNVILSFLDVNGIGVVINYDYPQATEDYVHRIGRTGRKDSKGESYTFFTQNDSKQAKQLVSILDEAGQEIHPQLQQWARSSYGGYGNSRYGRSNTGARHGTFKRNTMGGGSNYKNDRFGGNNGQSFNNKRSFDDNGDKGSSYQKNHVRFD